MALRRTFHAALAAATFYVGVQIGPVPTAAPDDWRAEASAEDARRLARIDQAWDQALRQARRSGYRPELANLGALAQRQAALPHSQPAPGAYFCRTVKLGSPAEDGPVFAAYDWFQCRVEESANGELVLGKVTGSQRPWGRLYPDNGRRLVYVGAVSWGSAEGPGVYGRDPRRDQIGVFERLGQDHYRLVLPWPKQESVLDLIELRR